MLQHIKDFYANLLQSKDDQLSDTNLEDLGLKARMQDKNDDLGSLLTINELGSVLKQMKSNKTPGIDVLGKIKILHCTCTKQMF